MANGSISAEPMAVQSSPQRLEGQLATDTITMEGRSGAKYQFQVFPWGTDFKPLGAVYSVLKHRTDGRYDVIYIGQTGDLSERFDDHHQAACFTRNGKTHIGVHLESSEQRRLAIEQDLIANYNPPCNKQK
jgi:hypothetical protein